MPPGPRPVLSLGHSPDPDDAFMWWPLGDAADGSPGKTRPPLCDTGRFLFRIVPADIETLNRRAADAGDLDVTACSAFTYPFVRERYAVCPVGASMGDGFGPKVVARERHAADWLKTPGLVIATPGEGTSAFLALRLLAGTAFTPRHVDFHAVMDEVREGRADAALVIHEGQLTFADAGLQQVVDLGAWWKEKTGFPMPLGLNLVRRDLDARFGPGASAELTRVLRTSVDYALRRRPIAIEYAMTFARGITPAQADRFVNMYVNALTRDLGPRGVQAIQAFLRAGAEAGLCPDPGPIDLSGVAPR